MKKRTKKIGSLLLAAAMAVSAVPAGALNVFAAADAPDFQYELRTAGAKGERSDTVTITEADLASGSYTFSVGGYIQAAENFQDDNTVTFVFMAWEPIDENGNEVYNHFRFTNVLDKQTSMPEYTVTASDGTVIKTKWPVTCFTKLGRRSGKVDNAGCSQSTNAYLMDGINGNDMFYDGNGGVYFIQKTTGERVECTVKDNGDGTAEISYPYNDLSTGEELIDSVTTIYWEPDSPADTHVASYNCIDSVSLSIGNQPYHFMGASSDEFPHNIRCNS